MKRIILIINFLIFNFILQAQEKLNYQLNGESIEFTISQEEIYVEFAINDKSTIERKTKNNFEELTKNSAILKIAELKGSFQNKKQGLKNKISTDFQRIEPVLVYNDGTRQIVKGELNIKMKPNSSLNDILKGQDFTYKLNEFEKDLYLIKSDLETSDLFKLIHQLQNDNRIEFVEPNFIRMIKPNTNDPFFASQWSINNQGYLGGTADADMDVDDAWAYVTGTGIKVAIIDTGVDLNHPDLQGNLLAGYDATGGNSNGNQTGNAHGTACAGIVAAKVGNNIGVVGVAYNAKIIPVKIFPTVGSPTDNMIANGINWAWQNGADILSNSYGGGSPSSTISNAVTNAVNNGRNGKGSIVLFASGNDLGGNGKPVSFPGNLDNVISVGASSMCDTRKNLSSCDGEDYWSSNFGNQLDIVAPGVKIYTTDISGSSGYNSGNYKSDFNGTSSSCPNVAGVVALILSANPNLTQQEARDILERNADKVNGYSYSNTSGQPNGTWNNEVGYGRVNALKAVEEAIGSSDLSLAGIDLCCSTNDNLTFTLSGLSNSNISVNWTKSSNLQIISSSNNSITVSPTSLSGSAYVRATVLGTSIFKTFWLGPPIVNLSTDIPFTNAVRVNLNGGSSYANAQQGITNITWQKLSGNGVLTNTAYFTIGQYPTTWVIYGKATAVNQCGSRYKTFNIGWTAPDNQDPNKLGWLSTNSVSPKFFIFPNPVVNELQINLGELFKENKRVFIVIYDITGKVVYKSNFTERFVSLNISEIPPGMYILKASNDIEFKTEKLIVK